MKFRIVRDGYAGFEVQAKRWWFPFWLQCYGRGGSITNTHSTIEQARAFAIAKASRVVEIVQISPKEQA